MAKFTLQLRTYIESGGKVFDFDYPLFDPTYKNVLESKVLDYYYFREIGLETIGQFKWFLKSKMNRIMPYYNQLYEANEVFKTYDPYKNKNVTTTDRRTVTSDSNGTVNNTNTSNGSSNSTDTRSDTPQAMLDGKDYATEVNKHTGDSGGTETTDGSTTGHVTSTDEYVSTIAGHDGMRYPTDILTDLRKTFINIDQMVIEELSDLFLNIY
jgi:hypothetical protein